MTEQDGRGTNRDQRNIYERIEAARENFGPITRGASGQVGTRSYKYADLDTVVEAIEGALRAEGVGIFPTGTTDGRVETELRVTRMGRDESLGVLSGSIRLPKDVTPQQMGSAITYYRRYLLVLMLNLLTEDDDGASASRPPRTRPIAEVEEAPVPQEAPPAPTFDAKANGWESDEIAQAAHSELRARILALTNDEYIDQCLTFKQVNGWPLATSKFEELETLVGLAEKFTQ